MQILRSFILSALVGSITAQTTVTTHVVQVGSMDGSIGFFPSNVQAAAGDLVQFQFSTNNHSVVQASFDAPCMPIQNTPASFYSGFMPTANTASANEVLTYTVRVQDTQPVWYYSAAAQFCQEGMVGAINAPTSGSQTLQAFTAAAAKASTNVSPSAGPGKDDQNSTSAQSSTTSVPSVRATGTRASAPQASSTNAALGLKSSVFGLGVAAAVAIVLL